MPFHKFVETHHGPTIFIENHGDGDLVLRVEPEGIRVAMEGSEVEKLRALLDEVLDDY